MLNTQTFANHTFDQNEESFDLLMPPQPDFYIGFPADIPLGADVNGNSINDKISFTIASYGIQNSNRLDTTLITNQLWHHEYDAAARFEGLVEAVTGGGGTPFSIGALLPNGQPDPAAAASPRTTSTLSAPRIRTARLARSQRFVERSSRVIRTSG